jgi:hypothetical protein
MKSVLQIHILYREKSIEGNHCAQVFFGVTSKIIYVTGMKTE